MSQRLKLPRAFHIAAAVLAATLIGFVVAPASAQAATDFDPFVDLGRYSPTSGSLAVQQVSGPIWKINQNFLWNSNARMYNLHDAHDDLDAYEGTIDFLEKPERYCFPGGTDGGSFSTNLPYGYRDTEFADDPQVKKSKGGGSGHSRFMVPNQVYQLYMQIVNDCGTVSLASETPLKVVTQDSFRNGSCAAGYQWCVTKNTNANKDVVPVTAGWRAGNAYSWTMNRLPNPSFESGGGGWYTQGRLGTAVNSQVNTGTNPLELDRWARFNCGGTGTGCKMASSTGFTVRPGDVFRHEVALRCLPVYSRCPARIAVNAFGTTGPEQISMPVSVPNDGYWHYYRMRAGGFNSHNEVELAVYNDTNTDHLDVDMATQHWSDNN